MSLSAFRGAPRPSLDYLNDECFDSLYLAAVGSTHEAIINAMLAAEDAVMQKPAGLCKALDGAGLMDVICRYGPAVEPAT